MPHIRSSVLDLKSLSLEQIEKIFKSARQLKYKRQPPLSQMGSVALLFFEQSTRTRLSFDLATHRLGFHPLILEPISSSLGKGETIEDTILNVSAMGPSLLVVRCGDEVDLTAVNDQVSQHMINAGWGKRGHPTQALLDAFTMLEHLPSLAKKKILFVGDVAHSRVVSSHFEILEKFNAQVGVCGPKDFLPKEAGRDFEAFSNLDKALPWADVIVALRVQKERHDSKEFSAKDYFKEFGISEARLKYLKKDAVLMHPGPVNLGIEIEQSVLKDKRSRVFEQVTNGVFVREALMRMMLPEKK